jgi:hypothetical protein
LNVVQQAFTNAYPILLLPVAAALLGPGEFGAFIVTHATGSFVGAAVDLGASVYGPPVLRSADPARRGADLQAIFVLRLLFAAAVLPAIAYVLRAFMGLSGTAFFAVSLYAVAAAVNPSAYHYAVDRPQDVAYPTMMARLLSVATILAVSPFVTMGAHMAVVSGASNVLVSAAQLIRVERGWHLTLPRWRNLVQSLATAKWRALECWTVLTYSTGLVPLLASKYGHATIAVYALSDRVVRLAQSLMYSFFLTYHASIATERPGVRDTLRGLFGPFRRLAAVWAAMYLPMLGALWIGMRLKPAVVNWETVLLVAILYPVALIGTVNGMLVFSVVQPRAARWVPLAILVAGPMIGFLNLVLPWSQPAHLAVAITLTSDVCILLASLVVIQVSSR